MSYLFTWSYLCWYKHYLIICWLMLKLDPCYFLAAAHIAGIHVILLLIGDGLMTGNNYLRMYAIASEPYPQNIHNVARFENLPNLIPDIASALCNGRFASWSRRNKSIVTIFLRLLYFLMIYGAHITHSVC